MVSASDAGPPVRVLRMGWVQIASATRPYFAASVDAPVAAFVAEADRHPVFELTPVENDPAGPSAHGLSPSLSP